MRHLKIFLNITIFLSFTYLGYYTINSNISHIAQVQKLQKEILELREENQLLIQYTENLQKQFTLKVNATAYTPRRKECNADYMNTAIMVKPKPGWHIAVSQDNIHLLGKRVYIKGYGVRLVADLMNERFTNKIDIMVGTVDEAKEFGCQELEIVVLTS